MLRRILSSLAYTCLLIMAGVPARAQFPVTDTLVARYSIQTSWFSPEKVYLHMDRTAYHSGETIWFNAYLANASSTSAYSPSNYVYAELISPAGESVQKVKVKRSGNSFPGHIDLREDMAGGSYTLRAYSIWQMNSPDDFMFHQNVDIVGEGKIRGERNTSKEEIDISFYPEGGRYFAGQPAKIGFKAMDSRGRSVDIEGRIVDSDGEEICKAATIHDGMGTLQFISSGEKELFLETAGGMRTKLPAPSAEGAAVTMVPLKGRRSIRISGSPGYELNLLLRDINGIRPIAAVHTDGRVKSLMLDDDIFNPGINTLMLIDSRGRTVSERHFYVYDKNAPSAKAVFTREHDGVRSPVKGSIELKDPGGNALEGQFSISVLRSTLSANIQDDGIASYLGLSSELRGRINDPRHYFDPAVPENERAAHLDLLMIIQGWSYYDMATIADASRTLGNVKYAREYQQSIKGRIKRILSSRTPKKFAMLIVVPKLQTSRYIRVEEGSRFIMDSLDFEEGTGFMIKIKREEGGADYIPSWNGDVFAEARKYAPAPGHSGISHAPVHVDYEMISDTLQAAVLTERASDVLGVNGHTLPKEDQQAFAFMNLIDYLKIKAPSFTYKDGLMYSTRSAVFAGYGQRTDPDMWDKSPVQLVVDGSVEPWVGFENLTISQTESISVSTQPDIIYNAKEGVVAVNLRYGATVSSAADRDQSLMYFIPLGWQTPQAFYAPRYDRGDYMAEGTDHRNTLYWNPEINIKQGRAEVNFFTSDDLDGPCSVCIEGLTHEGKPFSIISEVRLPEQP